jgi:predicted ATPase with chaperone activity
VEVADRLAPAAPISIYDTGIDPHVLEDLALKLAYTIPHFTTEWAAGRLCMSLSILADVLEQLRLDQLLEALGQDGPYNFRYAISGRGRERAARLMEVSGYVGPVPVSLEAYTEMLQWQFDRMPEVTAEDVRQAIGELVLPDQTVEVVGLAASSGRSLFLHGPPGTGKSSVGHLLHNATHGEMWLPHCIGVGSSIIRIFDSQCHQVCPLDVPPEQRYRVDQRWVRIRRPMIIVGGELTMRDLDLAYSTALRYYEAPIHMKANGGTFLLDDLGCQRVESRELLRRWIIPLEHQLDYMTLQTGQKIQVPFRQLLIMSTNLDPDRVMEPAILRRMGYRLYLGYPSEEEYTRIFQRYAQKHGVTADAGLIRGLLERYQGEGRPRRACDPRDLIERVRDICRYRHEPFELRQDLVELAWQGYFGDAAGLSEARPH